MKEPPPCFTEGCKHSLLYLSPGLITWTKTFQSEFITWTCCHWFSIYFFCNLAYLSLFTLFRFLKFGFLAVILPFRPFLMRSKWTLDGSTTGPDAFLGSWVRSLLDFFILFKDKNFSYCSYADSFNASLKSLERCERNT